MRNYTVKFGMLLKNVFWFSIDEYVWPKGGVSHANRNCTTDFAIMRL
jgi:hypothetical protein